MLSFILISLLRDITMMPTMHARYRACKVWSWGLPCVLSDDVPATFVQVDQVDNPDTEHAVGGPCDPNVGRGVTEHSNDLAIGDLDALRLEVHPHTNLRVGTLGLHDAGDRKSTRLNSSHGYISY